MDNTDNPTPYAVGDRIRSLITLNSDPKISNEPSVRPGHAGTITGHRTSFGYTEWTVMLDGLHLPIGMRDTEIKPYGEPADRTIADVMYDLTAGIQHVSKAFGVLRDDLNAAVNAIAPIVGQFVEDMDRARMIAAERDVCVSCATELPNDELTTDRNGDPTCGDCWDYRKGNPDA